MYADRSNRNGFPRFIVFRLSSGRKQVGVATCVVAYFVRREPPIPLLSDSYPIFDTSFAPKILTPH